MAGRRVRTTSVTTKIRTTALLIIVILATGLMFVMGFFMNSLTDNIMLDALQPMAKTAAQSVEGNLHTLADRFFMIRDKSFIASAASTAAEKQEVLENIRSGIECTWIGIYESDGRLLTGSEACPRNISGRKLFASIKATHNMVIEDTSIGSGGPEITMGLPIAHTRHDGEDDASSSYYLVGGYNYDILSDILNNIKVGPNGTAFIINDQGRVIAHRNIDKVFSREIMVDNFGFGSDEGAVLLPMRQGLTDAMNINGVGGKMFVSFSPIRGTLWSLGIQAPRGDFTSAARRALFTGASITVASIVIFSIFLTFFIRRILSIPLRAIIDSADKLADGEFGNPLPQDVIDRGDEIGRLGATFFTMSNSIRRLILDIGQLTDGAREGKLGERADHAAYQGDYRLILAGINSTLDVFCSHLDVMPEGLMFLDASRRVLYLNRTMSALLERHGLDKDDPGLLSALSGANDLPSDAASLFTLWRGEASTFQTDVSIGDDRGKERNYNLSLWRVGKDLSFAENGDGRHVCVMLILNDVTSLTRARIDAEAASRAKSDFLATMSHEIRTPLNAIIGLSEIRLQGELPGDSRDDIEKIHDSGMNLLGIINDILDISKIETGNLELMLAEYETPNLINDIVQLNVVRIGSKSIIFNLELDPAMPKRFYGDELRVKQIVSNILSNAFKYTQEGRVTLRVLWKKAGGEGTITFVVKDTGIGIRGEDMGKLFLKYSQLNATANRNIEGTGLGLSITKRLVDLMGGTVSVESEYGKGSMFSVTIPQKIASELPIGEKMAADLENLRLFGSARAGGANIVRAYMPYGSVLVVDDVPTNLDVAKGLLMPYGLAIYCAGSGAEAIEMIRAGTRFDLILMDHMMPQMDGIEATRVIRGDIGDGYVRNVPIVALTANAVKGNEAMFLENGFDGFISKPIDITRLDAALNKWVRDKQDAKTLMLAEREHADKNIAPGADRFSGYIAGIDFDAGVKRYGGKDIYVRILESYARSTPALLEQLGGVSRDTLGDFAVTVHGLKGSSYGICADEIAKGAELLEKAAKADDFETVSADNGRFIRSVESLLKGIETMLKALRESGEGMVKTTLPYPEESLLNEMLDAARRFDWQAMKKAAEEMEAYSYESGGDLVAWLNEQLENLEYGAIEKKLEDVLAKKQ
ncbi:MAG: response regulator [Synergistaceae bacterium]|jgi:signal transduction histidine kinase/AmiR/NasT family two-component response regulator/HAMP domain-containing protein|nr:response regulator [Synergistaceae bacterium]